MIRFFRVLLIQIAKVLPFIICGIVAISFLENIFSLLFERYAMFDGSYIPYKPISWTISNIIEYDWTTIVVLIILSIALETCIWNKLATIYLCVNLYEKSYFDFELDIWQIYIISILNLIISAYFTYKGITIFLKNAK